MPILFGLPLHVWLSFFAIGASFYHFIVKPLNDIAEHAKYCRDYLAIFKPCIEKMAAEMSKKNALAEPSERLYREHEV